MRTLIFLMVVMVCNLCYGQIPVTKDRVLILVTNRNTCNLSREAERHFMSEGVRKHLDTKDIQFIHLYGQDLDIQTHNTWHITHYPAIVYLMKDGNDYKLAQVVSGAENSKVLAKLDKVQWLLGIKAETYRTPPTNNPLIPGSQPQIASPPQQFINQWESAPPSS